METWHKAMKAGGYGRPDRIERMSQNLSAVNPELQHQTPGTNLSISDQKRYGIALRIINSASNALTTRTDAPTAQSLQSHLQLQAADDGRRRQRPTFSKDWLLTLSTMR
jgi:hypothetical protein